MTDTRRQADPTERLKLMASSWSFAKVIYAARKQAGLTQKQLAERCSVNQAAVCQWEDPHKQVKLETLEKVAAAVGMTVEDLLKIDTALAPASKEAGGHNGQQRNGKTRPARRSGPAGRRAQKQRRGA
jgi:transcriptional regulator with XRE-family HTH domain